MPAKITTPISILVLSYLLIIGLCFVALVLAGVMAYDLNRYFKNQDDFYAMKVCRPYLEQEKHEMYEKCFQGAVEYFRNQKSIKALKH